MAAGRIAAGGVLLLFVSLATHAVSARMLLQGVGLPGRCDSGHRDPIVKVPEGKFSVIMVPYDNIDPRTFIYGSNGELTIAELVEDPGYPGTYLCMLPGYQFIKILAGRTFLERQDYKGSIEWKGETIHIDSDRRCQTDLCKEDEGEQGCHAVRCVLAA